MATIAQTHNVFTVLVRYTTAPEAQQPLLDVLTPTTDVFARQPGFVSLTVHRSLDGSQVIVYLQWRSRADHEACMNSPEVFAAGQELMALLQTGTVTMDVQPFEIVLSKES